MKVVRLERGLHGRISDHTGFLCEVHWTGSSGFFGLGFDGRSMYFTDEPILHMPFCIVLDQPPARWIEDGRIEKGDRFYKRGRLIYRWPQNDCLIQYSPGDMVDLDRTVCETPPRPEVIQAWMQRLIHAVADKGHFEGMGGTLRVILDRLSDPLPEHAFPLSPASRFALPHVTAMLQSAAAGDGAGFVGALEHLIGLGPGLTPSADDMLVGFLASQKMLSTPFWKEMERSASRASLKKAVKDRTTPMAAEMLRDALDGYFSELLYEALAALAGDAPDGPAEAAIKSFFKWGHSSGTDMLAGVILSLSTLYRAG